MGNLSARPCSGWHPVRAPTRYGWIFRISRFARGRPPWPFFMRDEVEWWIWGARKLFQDEFLGLKPWGLERGVGCWVHSDTVTSKYFDSESRVSRGECSRSGQCSVVERVVTSCRLLPFQTHHRPICARSFAARRSAGPRSDLSARRLLSQGIDIFRSSLSHLGMWYISSGMFSMMKPIRIVMKLM